MTKTLIKKQLMEVFAWLYRALMGIVSVTLGVFGSVFNTFSTLYQAKDNDLLFAMPITERSVLTIPMNLLKSRKRVRQRAPRFREFHLHSTKRNSSSLAGARWDKRFLRQLGKFPKTICREDEEEVK